jgi:bifunctional non-homologous end joining protein LigD
VGDAMVTVTHADRVIFPELGVTKGDVVRYYEACAPHILPHVAGRPLTLRRYPKGIAAPGFFQKNVPPHYPASMERVELPKREGVTIHPMISEADHLPFVANQGAIELHVPCAKAADLYHPDRLVVDLDPPEGAVDLARRGALIVKEELARYGIPTVPVATGSKGYHVVAPIRPRATAETIAMAMQELATLLEARHPEVFTTAFRVAKRGGRVFADWLRNVPHATVVVPFSLRARARATVAVPLGWDELETTAPDAFSLRDEAALLARPDPLLELAENPADTSRFVAAVGEEFGASGLEVARFDRFRS